MKDQKHKTTALIEAALKAHRRKMFLIDLYHWCGLALIVGCVALAVLF